LLDDRRVIDAYIGMGAKDLQWKASVDTH
jgi:hypothetical protein